jgi:hypothetical protein
MVLLLLTLTRVVTDIKVDLTEIWEMWTKPCEAPPKSTKAPYAWTLLCVHQADHLSKWPLKVL